jgi:hypothetical protein
VPRRLVLGSLLLTVTTLLAMPGTTLATSYRIIHNYCGGDFNWTTHFKARVVSEATSGVNKLTIDSWVQAIDPSTSHWYRAESWPRVQTTFTPDGTTHSLAVGRQATGGVDSRVRIVFKMQAWDHGLVAWTQRITSVAC